LALVFDRQRDRSAAVRDDPHTERLPLTGRNHESRLAEGAVAATVHLPAGGLLLHHQTAVPAAKRPDVEAGGAPRAEKRGDPVGGGRRRPAVVDEPEVANAEAHRHIAEVAPPGGRPEHAGPGAVGRPFVWRRRVRYAGPSGATADKERPAR